MCPPFLNEILHYFHGSFYPVENRTELSKMPLYVLRIMKALSKFYSGRELERETH